MKKIVLISCVSKKQPIKAKAKDLYTSALFKKNFQFANKLQPDEIFILSAKHGLLMLNDEIEPYDTTLNKMPVKKRKEWATLVINQLKICTDVKRDHFIILAGNRYRQFILPELTSYDIPLEGLGIGKQLQYLKKQLSND